MILDSICHPERSEGSLPYVFRRVDTSTTLRMTDTLLVIIELFHF